MAGGFGVGASLASLGMQQKNEAVDTVGKAAGEEASRRLKNDQLEGQREAGNKQLGATTGALIGMQVAGPWGALVGSVAGAIGGGLF